MICFKDKTFCRSYMYCKDGKGCHRALTPAVREEAWLWWNKGKMVEEAPPIMQWLNDEPTCFRNIDEEDS